MRYKTIFRILGVLLMMFSLSMLPPVVVIGWYHRMETTPFLISFGITLITGFILWLPFRTQHEDLKTRDGFFIVVVFWVVLCLFGALPFILSKQPNISITDAVFESVSGLTTTGATVLSGLDFLPKAILYYRQQLQFLGGMGIIVLGVAILPMLGIGGMQLYRAETPGPLKDTKLTPRITETAKSLWLIYLGLTLACALCYWIAGMTPFDALGESFSTVSTGGFTLHDDSLAFYHNSAAEMVAIVFMILGGTNFSLHFLGFNRRTLKIYWKDPEFRTYLMILACTVTITAIALLFYHVYHHPSQAISKAAFDVVSLLTTTGFVAGNFSTWPTFIPIMIMTVAIIGGCGGSTSGGIKVIRSLLVYKQGHQELQRLIHPRSIMLLKFGNQILPENVINTIWGFLSVFGGLFVLYVLFMLAQGINLTTAFGAAVATLANTGASIGDVARSFAPLDNATKWVSILAMLAGRLEIFTVLVLLTPAFWRK